MSKTPKDQRAANFRRNRKPSRFSRFFVRLLLFLLLGGASLATIASVALYLYLEPQLPDIEVLEDVRYQLPMSVYSKDGKLIAQFGEKKRSPLSIAEVPERAIRAFLAAEDDRFFDHPGVDYQGLLRATFTFLKTGEKRQGGSTITMQVARNFFLSSEKTFFRKIKEILLAIKIESRLPKRQILELYLNKIYFGQHAYGIDAAAQVYYGKHVYELSLSEIAMIAGLPKAPSSFNPVTNPERALVRRDYVLKRMLKLHSIDDQEYQAAIAEPVTAKLHTAKIELNAPYVAEMVRSEMYRQYGDEAYVSGFKVFTTIDSRLQIAADRALRLALHEYDERHGYRGAQRRVNVSKLKHDEAKDEELSAFPDVGDTVAGIVLAVGDHSTTIYLGHGRQTELDWSGVKWARKYIDQDAQGPLPRSFKEILKVGDIVRLRSHDTGGDTWMLAQIPEAEGALVALDPARGGIVALTGGFEYSRSKFNRASQAQRQPGSGFKPILYAAALNAGFTPASVINDAPIIYYDPSMEGGAWRPKNYSGRFYGPTRLRVALVKSRNLVSIRLLRKIGLKKAIETAREFGFSEEDLPRSLSLALGSGTATPLKMAQAYAVFANGGFRVEPYLIDQIQMQDGGTLFQATPPMACMDCDGASNQTERLAPRVLSPQVHYMMNSMLLDVVREGTATRALQLGRRDLAGKTGTTNEQKDAWFNGYVPSLVTISWLGFDSSKPLGEEETGGQAALPMWMHFMREALKDVPEHLFPQPDGLTTARIDPATGMLALPGSSRGLFEVFPSDRVPRYYAAPSYPSTSSGGSTDSSDSRSMPTPSAEPAREPSGTSGGASGKTIESLF